MARVTWAPEALREITDAVQHLIQFNPAAASDLGAKLLEAGESLAIFPHRGRPAAAGTRALVTVRPYALIYEVVGDHVRIVSVRHSARRPHTS